jgi:hypothetical protein
VQHVREECSGGDSTDALPLTTGSRKMPDVMNFMISPLAEALLRDRKWSVGDRRSGGQSVTLGGIEDTLASGKNVRSMLCPSLHVSFSGGVMANPTFIQLCRGYEWAEAGWGIAYGGITGTTRV